jgi:hypothetical protein
MHRSTQTFTNSRPLWVLTLASWLTCECVVFWIQYAKHLHPWLSLSTLYLLAMVSIPFTAGVHLNSKVASESETNSAPHLAKKYSEVMATMVITSYLTLIACAIGFL